VSGVATICWRFICLVLQPGKALYTTIRELTENSLDASEAAGYLPDISIEVEEMDTASFNTLRGIATRQRVDHSLYSGSTGSKAARSAKPSSAAVDSVTLGDGEGEGEGGAKGKGDSTMYYRITCRDNGCGMPHERIPDMLGRVLSGEAGESRCVSVCAEGGGAARSFVVLLRLQVWCAADAWKIWTWGKDGSHMEQEVYGAAH
jgi:hypothetical protein